jgi:hypothetical protein
MNEVIGMVLFSIFVTSCFAFLFLSFRFNNLAKYAIITLSGSVMIAHGSRMISQSILYPNMSYIPNVFDVIFDWLTLVLLGIFVFWYGLKEFYSGEKKYFKMKK